MDWTFWVGGAVILGLFIVTRVFLHERHWSQRPRPEEPDEPYEPYEADERERHEAPNAADEPDEPRNPEDRP
ncbi:MAG TPA: hypothetical protein VFR98_05765 [Agromyces sp.]|nr:hypothetical protein [Agromyces sp.]